MAELKKNPPKTPKRPADPVRGKTQRGTVIRRLGRCALRGGRRAVRGPALGAGRETRAERFNGLGR